MLCGRSNTMSIPLTGEMETSKLNKWESKRGNKSCLENLYEPIKFWPLTSLSKQGGGGGGGGGGGRGGGGGAGEGGGRGER